MALAWSRTGEQEKKEPVSHAIVPARVQRRVRAAFTP